MKTSFVYCLLSFLENVLISSSFKTNVCDLSLFRLSLLRYINWAVWLKHTVFFSLKALFKSQLTIYMHIFSSWATCMLFGTSTIVVFTDLPFMYPCCLSLNTLVRKGLIFFYFLNHIYTKSIPTRLPQIYFTVVQLFLNFGRKNKARIIKWNL